MEENQIILFFDKLGYNGPLIMFILSIICLSKTNLYLYGYLFFWVLNKISNEELKMIFREPRPKGFDEINAFDNNKFEGAHRYGMPSGHAQTTFFSIAYLWYVFRSLNILFSGVFIGMLTVIQRWKYKKHSAKQLLIGSILGIFFAYISYFIVHLFIGNN